MGENPVVVSFHESLLRLSDIELLSEPSWLNDTIISFYFEYLDVHKFKQNPRLLFVPPQVTQCIKIAPSSEIACFLDPLDANTKDFIFFALNDNEQTDVSGGTHWSLLVFSYPERKIFHFDSSLGSNYYPALDLGTKLLDYFRLPMLAESIQEPKSLQQNNGYDCGIHVLAQCELLANYACHNNRIYGCPFLEREVVQNYRNDILNIIKALQKPKILGSKSRSRRFSDTNLGVYVERTRNNRW